MGEESFEDDLRDESFPDSQDDGLDGSVTDNRNWLFICLGVAVFVSSVLIAVFWIVHQDEADRDKAVSASYKYLAKEQKSSLPLPGQLEASFFNSKGIWYANGPVGDGQLADLAKSEEITNLELKFSEVTAKGLSYLQAEPLKALTLLYSDLSIPELQSISKIESLKALMILKPTSFEDKSAVGLTGPKGLKVFTFRLTKLKSDGAVAFLKALPEIEKLDFSGNRGISDGVFSALLQEKQLRYLNLSETSVTAQGLASFLAHANIDELSISRIGIDDSGIQSIKTTRLSELNISGNPVTDLSLKHLARQKRLKRIDVRNCVDLTSSGIKTFQSLRPNCELVF